MKIICTGNRSNGGRWIVPTLTALLLAMTFWLAEAVLGKQEDRFSLEDTCCLAYSVVEYDDEEVETSSGTIGWGLSWRKGFSEPVLDPGAQELLEKYGAVYRGDQEQKKIYLTFDLGYEAGYTESILDTLKEKNVKAVFFLLENYVNRNPELVQRMIDEGHYIGNHTLTHKSLPSLDVAGINREVDGFAGLVQDKFGVKTEFFRPPCGEYNEDVLSLLQEKGYTTLFWSFAYKDWDRNESIGADMAAEKVLAKLHNGMVILLHSANPDNSMALPEIIDKAIERGFVCGDPKELTGTQKTSP